MPPARKTRSGRTAPPPPSKRVRTKGGCLTCRIRRKKCDESRDHDGGCETCSRLKIECLGYSTKRPEWLKGTQVDTIKRKIKHFLADHNAKSSSRAQDDAFCSLHTSRTRPARQPSDTDESDSDLDPEPEPAQSSSFIFDSPPCAFLDLAYTSPVDWSTPLHMSWNPPFNPFPFSSSGDSDDAEGSNYFGTGLYDLSPMSMPYEDSFLDLQVGVGSYQSYNPGQDCEVIWASFFRLLGISSMEDQSLRVALVVSLQNDPEGVQAVTRGLAEKSLSSGQAVIRRLLDAGYNSRESRALTCHWMIAHSLSQGNFRVWGDCLDLALIWVNDMSSGGPGVFSVSSLSVVERLILKRSVWCDIIAGATTKRHPQRIDIYREILASNQHEIMGDCPNKTALALAEIVALAAHPEQLPRASDNIDRLRADLVLPADPTLSDESPSNALIHTAGARLYLEIVANRGVVDDPAIEEAVYAVCALASKADQLRDFAFWIFLAGCHTTNNDRWVNCSTMMDNILPTGSDASVKAAFGVMNEVHDARQAQNIQPDMWRARMNDLGALLV